MWKFWCRLIGVPNVLIFRAEDAEDEAERLMEQAAALSVMPNDVATAVGMTAVADQLLAQAREDRRRAKDLVGGE